MFAKSALGKVGVSIPKITKHSQDNDNEQNETAEITQESVRGQVPSNPLAQQNLGTASGEMFEPLPPITDLPQYPPLDSFNSVPDWNDSMNWGEPNLPNLGVSLEEAEKKNKDAQREAQYEYVRESTRKNPEKPWLDPLPHPLGPFAYRESSTTRGLGGEIEDFQPIPFDPITKKPQEIVDLYDWEKDTDKNFDWSKLDPVTFATNIRDWMGMGPDERKAAEAMQSGYAIMRQNPDFKNTEKNMQAAKLFEKAAKRWPDSVLEEDALFLAAECCYFSDNYSGALKNYEKLVSKHRSTKCMDTSAMRLFRIGRYWEKRCDQGVHFANFRDKTRPTFDTFGHMKRAYEAIYTNDPTGPFGDKALMALAGANMNRGVNQGDSQFVEAATLYASLPDINARSEYIVQARKLELLARSKAYVGAEYDAKALEEASKLADQTLRQYGDELGGEKNNVLDIKESLTLQKAERLYEAGVYYEKKKMYSSARYNYERLLQEYPTSTHYTEVEKRYAKIQNLEDMDDHLKWLKNALVWPGTSGRLAARNAGRGESEQFVREVDVRNKELDEERERERIKQSRR
jgi:TolA-binding protein